MRIELYIDFDGVILNTVDITYKRLYDLKINISDEIDTLDYYANLDWNALLKESHQINDSINNIRKLMESDLFNVHVLSNVCSDNEIRAKTDYLEKAIPELDVIFVRRGYDKCDVVDCKNAILVDDYMGNLELWDNKGGISIKFSDKGRANKFMTVSSLDMLIDKYDLILDMIISKEIVFNDLFN